MPRSPRLKNVTQWLPAFYDSSKHNPENRGPKNPDDPKKFTYDIYLLLMQDEERINNLITELEEKNASIKNTIASANGHNEYGLGGTVSECATVSCCGHDCQTRCCTKRPCSFQGIFCSAWGGDSPPVCVNGDLYGAKPSWCPLTAHSADCKCSCSRDPQGPLACDFQGQLILDNPSGPTEVEQAIRILRALNADITDIKKIIGDFAEAVAALLAEGQPSEPPDLRNKIVYAWKDAPAGEGKSQLSHLVSVEITGYPDSTKLPHIGVGGATKNCLVLQDYKGSFLLTTSRYDQDIPLPQWNLRRRKYGLFPGGEEFPPGYVAKIAEDVQDNGKIDTYGDYVNSILYNFAITSQTKAYYGPEKSDIYIEKVK
jgi:hypothetical protein